MKKEMLKEFICALIFFLIIVPFKVKALPMNGMELFYSGDGQKFSTTDVANNNWNGHQVSYIDLPFKIYNFSPWPNVYYAFFPNNLGCSEQNCLITGTVASYSEYGYQSNVFKDSTIQIESNGTYKYCTITRRYEETNFFTFADFQCSAPNVNNGFNIVISNLQVFDSTWTYYGIIPDSMKIQSNISTGDIIENQNNSTQNIINNNNQNKQEIIDNQNKNQQQTNEKLDGINDSITNDDVDTDGAGSFFNGFNDTDHGGISGVVTAPLKFINKLTGTCSPLSFKVLDADIELPCGDTLFWNKTEVSSFRITWNILLGGPILYLLLCKLFKVIEGLKNPDDSRVEVMKL